MSMVFGLNLHRQQITFDALETESPPGRCGGPDVAPRPGTVPALAVPRRRPSRRWAAGAYQFEAGAWPSSTSWPTDPNRDRLSTGGTPTEAGHAPHAPTASSRQNANAERRPRRLRDQHRTARIHPVSVAWQAYRCTSSSSAGRRPRPRRARDVDLGPGARCLAERLLPPRRLVVPLLDLARHAASRG
jgi:hypothetical protein